MVIAWCKPPVSSSGLPYPGDLLIESPEQPRLFSDLAPDQASPLLDAGREPDRTAPAPDAAAPIWLQRMSLLVLVLFCVYLGVMVMILPWWTAVWDHNLFLQSHPWLWNILRRGPVRGIISGMGLLDVWIGISEAVHYRDHRR